jgi:hypothetical protein
MRQPGIYPLFGRELEPQLHPIQGGARISQQRAPQERPAIFLMKEIETTIIIDINLTGLCPHKK